jgi:peptide/nickel transport system substrate-binding protein
VTCRKSCGAAASTDPRRDRVIMAALLARRAAAGLLTVALGPGVRARGLRGRAASGAALAGGAGRVRRPGPGPARPARLVRLGALSAAAALALAACSTGGGQGAGSQQPGTSPPPASRTGPAAARGASFYDEGLAAVVSPSDTASTGTLALELSGRPDSTDYQDTYDPYMWDFVRLYSMQLMTYRSCPGACGTQLVPGLAAGPGLVSDGGLVWTYHLRAGVRFENGQVVTSQDVKYGIERSYARSVLPYGPTYFQALLADPSYPGPYLDRARNVLGLTSVTTPSPTTIVFHLQHPFADFNYVAALPQSTPVQPAWDTGRYSGASFQLHPESSGPYEFQAYTPGRRLVLVRNPYWKQTTDPQARQLVSKIIVTMSTGQARLDRDLLSGAADLDLSGAGMQGPAVGAVLTDPRYRADADDALSGFLQFAYLNTIVIPDIHCREAVEYAADRAAIQDAWGGPVTGGAVASTVLPPTVGGYQPADPFDALAQPGGDLAAARVQLRLCGQSGGFTTGLAYQAGSAPEAAAAQALRAALARVGITARLDSYRAGEYYTDFAGVPAYADSHDLGIVLGHWGADWPDGYGFLDELANGNAIAPVGNTNIAEISNPQIDALFARAAGQDDAAARTSIWTRIDARVLALAAILPLIYQKVLLYRNPDVTNVYADWAYGMYNYAVLGLR